MQYCGKDIQQAEASFAYMEIRTTRPVPLRVRIRSARRWGWFGPKGWRVRVTLVSEQRTTWRWGGFASSVQEICAQVGLTEHDPVWSAIERPQQASKPETGWTPFMMF